MCVVDTTTSLCVESLCVTSRTGRVASSCLVFMSSCYIRVAEGETVRVAMECNHFYNFWCTGGTKIEREGNNPLSMAS
jgi:hypothetical protein